MDGSDVSLVARARDGDSDAFRELVERHGRNVFRLSYRLTRNEEDAEDVTQEAFIKAYRNLSRFEEKSEFGSWIYRIATNCALDAMRRRRRTRTDALPDPQEGERELATSAPSPEKSAEGGEIGRRLAAAMTRLSPNERTAFVLRHHEGRSLVEIAEALGIKPGAAKTCVFRAVAKMREQLGALAENA